MKYTAACAPAAPISILFDKTLRRLLSVLIVSAICIGFAGMAWAQAPAVEAPPATVSAAELERLVKTLESEPERTKLVEQLKALIAAQRTAPLEDPGLGEVVIATLSNSVAEVSTAVREIGDALLDARGAGDWIRNALNDGAKRDRILEGLWRVAAMLALGALAQFMVHLLLSRVRRTLTHRQGGVVWRLGAGLLALILDALPVAAFAAAAYGILPFLDPAPDVRLIAIALANAAVVSQALILLCRLALQPHDPALRVLPLSDGTAAYLDIWLRRFIWLGIFGYVALEAGRLLGLPRSGYVGLLSVLGLIIAALLIMLILQNRKPVAQWLKRHRDGQPVSALAALRFRVADTWHLVAILYIVAVYVVWLLRPGAGPGFLLRATLFTGAALVVGWLLERGLDRLVRRWFSISEDIKARFPDLEARANRYLPFVLSVTRIVVAALTLLAILFIWGVSSFSILIDEPGRRIVLSLLRMLGVVIAGFALWELGGVALERLLGRVTAKGRMPAARVQTMLPVARYIFGLVLCVIGGLMLLSEIGIEIGPLLAGAGVVGLAIGLGAQSLVKDLIAGFSLIAEDALAVGDVVKIGPNAGLVEGLTIRTIRLRGFDGTVQTIPLGSVTVVENMTKEFSYAVINCGVAYKENVDRVIAILKEIGAEMQADPEFATDILAPIEVVGLDAFQDSALLIKARFKTYPIKQWGVLREFNRRLKARFDKEGIEIPFPYRTLTLGDDVTRLLAELARGDRAAQAKDVTPSDQGKPQAGALPDPQAG